MAQEVSQTKPTYLPQLSRLTTLALYIFTLLLASKLVTGEWFPAESGKRLWILSGIGFYFFILLTAPWFRPPRDSVSNAVAAGLLLSLIDLQGVTLLRFEIIFFRGFAIVLSIMVAIAAVVAMALREVDSIKKPFWGYLSKLSYHISDSFGRGEIIFTPPALISIIGYYQTTPIQQLWLLFVWVFLITVRPIELIFRLVAQVRNISKSSQEAELIGTISRVDNPNIVRVAIESGAKWVPGNVAIACLPNSEQVQVLPLFHHVQESQIVGTGLCHGAPESMLPEAMPGYVYYNANSKVDGNALINDLSGIDGGAEMVGFVVEDSHISVIKFEVFPDADLEEGKLTFCMQGQQVIYYQILDAKTAEESFEKNPRGKHVAFAAQLGCLSEKGFVKYGWLPSMNSPVFTPKTAIKSDTTTLKTDEFAIGKIPGSDINVIAGFYDLHEFHSAIIGVTGTGKTELAFDIIKKALSMDTKVFCVDFTNEYKTRLSDFSPKHLSLDDKRAKELDQKLFAVDTGTFGAKEEKKALKLFVEEIKDPVTKSVDEFLSSEGSSLGIFELPEITNTKATLRATELYLSSIMDWARNHRRARRILIVLEEAHTIIPETFGSGFDHDTQWVVGRISQIALQGRKYGVGLLVISQRTALVSKSILSQCNTHFTFSLVDKTSLDYLANVYSPEHVRSIPNLRFLESIAYGKAIRSERPLLFKIKYDKKKKDASDSLNKTV